MHLRDDTFYAMVPPDRRIDPIKANIVVYDILTYKHVIMERLKAFEVSDLQKLTNKYTLRYLDDMIFGWERSSLECPDSGGDQGFYGATF